MISRRMVLGLVAFFFCIPAFAAQLSFYSYEDGMNVAKDQSKMVYILFGSDYCPWCHKQKDVLLDDDVLASLSEYVMIYVDTAEERDIASKYRVRSIPVSMILDSDGRVINKNVGYMDKSKFLRWVR